jgi:hypothetical protein
MRPSEARFERWRARLYGIRNMKMSASGTTSPFNPGRMKAGFHSICVTSVSGQHVRFEDDGPLG